MSTPPTLANIGLQSTNNQYFANSLSNDLVIFTQSNQNVFIASSSNYIQVGSNGISTIAPHAASNPTIALTSYATSNSAGAFNIASASTESNLRYAWHAFDNNTTTYWQASNGLYTTNGAYVGSTATTDMISKSLYKGEYVQIQLPTGIVPKTATILSLNGATQVPASCALLGSEDGRNWSLIASNATPNTSSTLTLTPPSNAIAASYYRLVTTSNSTANTTPAITTLNIAGTPAPLTTTTAGAVGVGVTNPVEALEVGGNAIFGGNISAGNLGMFRNRIINGSFMVDQRGTATTPATTNGAYGPDRFCFNVGGTMSGFSISQSNLSLSDSVVTNLGFRYALAVNTGTRSAGAVLDMRQKIELWNCYDIMTTPVTLSFWAKSSTAGQVSILYNPTITISLTTSWQYYTIQFNPMLSSPSTGAMNTIGIDLIFRAVDSMPSGAINYYTGIQLEKGTIATPFEFRPYPVELQMCQRYYEAIVEQTGLDNYLYLSNYAAGGGTGTTEIFSYKTPKRAIPTISTTITNTNIQTLNTYIQLGSLAYFFSGSVVGNYSIRLTTPIIASCEL